MASITRQSRYLATKISLLGVDRIHVESSTRTWFKHATAAYQDTEQPPYKIVRAWQTNNMARHFQIATRRTLATLKKRRGGGFRLSALMPFGTWLTLDWQLLYFFIGYLYTNAAL